MRLAINKGPQHRRWSSSPTTISTNNSAARTASSPSSPIKVFVNANGFCVATLLHVDE
jgi:hypothetical protein